MSWDLQPSRRAAKTAPAQEPYRGYMDRLLSRLEADAARTAPMYSSHRGSDRGLGDDLVASIRGVASDLTQLSTTIHGDPELCFEEHRAARSAVQVLEALGCEAELASFGLPTAFRASAGSGGGPRVAIFAEYDALPDIGHACGHNIICAAAVGAFVALARHADDLGGTVELIGSPAEEGGGGKEIIIRAGGLAHVDAAMMVHPFSFNLAEHPMLGFHTLDATYRGRAAHASATAFLGRNALDAVVSAYSGVSQMRQHLPPTDRVHGVITDGGNQPNIVPERASASFYLRSASPEGLAELSDRMVDVLEAAALGSATTLELTWGERPYAPVRHNGPLVRRFAHHMEARSERRMLPRGVFPDEITGSTDMGNVSLSVPSIHPLLAVSPAGVSTHSAAFASWAVGAAAESAVIDGACGLALTALDVLHDPILLADARAEFAAADRRPPEDGPGQVSDLNSSTHAHKGAGACEQ